MFTQEYGRQIITEGKTASTDSWGLRQTRIYTGECIIDDKQIRTEVEKLQALTAEN